MLPTYTRLGSTAASTVQLSSRKSLRTKEKFLVLLLFATLGFVCLGGFFYLPDNFVPSDKVREVYKKIQNAGPEMFIPAPPVARRHRHGVDSNGENNDDHDDGSHIFSDRDRLNAKIQHDWAAGGSNDHLEKPIARPNIEGVGKDAPLMNAPSPENANPSLTEKAEEPLRLRPNGEDSDPVARERRNKVKEVSFVVFIYFYS